jgi:hypothetical protein
MDTRCALRKRRVSDREPLFRDTRRLGVVGSVTLRMAVGSMDRELRNLRVPYFLRVLQATKHTLISSLHVATGVAIGGFLLAVAAIVHALSTGSGNLRLLLLALLVFPLVTGLPAFVIGFVATSLRTAVFEKCPSRMPSFLRR